MRLWVMVTLIFCLVGALPSQGAEVMRSHFPVRTDHHQCHDVRGARVSTIRFDNLRDVAHAVIMNHVPYIVLNPTRLKTIPPKLQAFFYEHECAHHILGHNYNPTLASEAEADCLAVKVGRDKGLFARSDIVAFRPWIEPLRGSLRGHLPGKQRQRLMTLCFDDAEPDPNMAELMGSARAAATRFREAAQRRIAN